jgi:hypothetical protein
MGGVSMGPMWPTEERVTRLQASYPPFERDRDAPTENNHSLRIGPASRPDDGVLLLLPDPSSWARELRKTEGNDQGWGGVRHKSGASGIYYRLGPPSV